MDPTKIDRIDNRGDIREHLTVDGIRTICGIEIGYRQAASGNRQCRRCLRLAQVGGTGRRALVSNASLASP